MSKLRKSAKGRECQIRLSGICNGGGETTVLCHLPGAGMGLKQPDFLAAYGCSDCHDVVDGRRRASHLYPAELKVCFYEGVFRTQKLMLDEGLITIGD